VLVFGWFTAFFFFSHRIDQKMTWEQILPPPFFFRHPPKITISTGRVESFSSGTQIIEPTVHIPEPFFFLRASLSRSIISVFKDYFFPDGPDCDIEKTSFPLSLATNSTYGRFGSRGLPARGNIIHSALISLLLFLGHGLHPRDDGAPPLFSSRLLFARRFPSALPGWSGMTNGLHSRISLWIIFFPAVPLLGMQHILFPFPPPHFPGTVCIPLFFLPFPAIFPLGSIIGLSFFFPGLAAVGLSL